MSGLYYVEAADWLRAVGVKVVEIDDWETRARSSGGFAAATARCAVASHRQLRAASAQRHPAT